MSLNFDDITFLEEPVRVGGTHYVLREADGVAATKYRSAVMKATRITDNKVMSVDGSLAETEPYLVSLCLWEANGDGIFNKPVPLNVIKAWPARVQKALYTRATEMSQLGETETKEALEKRIADAEAQLKALAEGGEKNS